MLSLDSHPSGRHFLQIPGPSPVPDRILRALSLPTIDHRGPEFAVLGKTVIAGLQQVFQTRHPVAIYPASGTGAWEAALVNVLSPGDAVLMVETGHFAMLWQKLALRLGLDVLVEVHDADELNRAVELGATMIGVNQRDLVTFEVDRERAAALRPLMRGGTVSVAESGVGGPADAAGLRAAGYDAILVGESVVTASDPEAAVRALVDG